MAARLICLNYQAGLCNLGAQCPNVHPPSPCEYEQKRQGSCKKGLHCDFSHNPLALKVKADTNKGAALPSHPLSDSGTSHGSSAASHGTKHSVCRNYQAGKCNLGARCRFVHPSQPCKIERQLSGSCPKGLQCSFSHNPLDLVVKGMEGYSVDELSSAASSESSERQVCHSYQRGLCKIQNCKRYHPPPTKPCFFETKAGSCTNGLDCRFCHAPQPQQKQPRKDNDKPVDVTHKLKGNNLFWMKAANVAGMSRRLGYAQAKELVTLDELRGRADAVGVDLVAGSLSIGKKCKSSDAAPMSIRLIGPMHQVQAIRDIIEKQEALLEKLPKHEARWMFEDDPWARGIWESKTHAFCTILGDQANAAFAWWEEVKTSPAKSASRAARSEKVQAAGEVAMLLSLAVTSIHNAEIQVAYTSNIVNAPADAVIISCGPYMSMEDGVAQDIIDWHSKAKDTAMAAKQARFGNGPLPPSEFVMVNLPKPQSGSTRIFCSYVPPATTDEAKNAQLVRTSIRKVMQHIAEHNTSGGGNNKIRSVALPLLGTGRYGHGPGSTAVNIVTEVLAQLPHSGVKRVHLLDLRVEALEALQAAVQDAAVKHGSECKAAKLPVQETTEPGWYYYVAKIEGASAGNYDAAMRNSVGMGHVIQEPGGAWFPMFPDVRDKVEKAYQHRDTSPDAVRYNMDNIKYPDGVEYAVRFGGSTLTQINTKTGFQRKVMRKERSYVWKKPDLPAIQKLLKKQLANTSKMAAPAGKEPGSPTAGKVIGVVYQALDQGSADSACRIARLEIEKKFEVQSFIIPLPDHSISPAEEGDMRKMLADLPLGLSMMAAAGGSSIRLTGLGSDLDKAKQRIVESPIYQRNQRFTYPSTWSCNTPSQLAVVKVADASPEWHKVAAELVKDMPTAIVTKVERVQNDLLWKAYQGNLRILHERYSVNGLRLFKDSDLTKRLWHGTSGTDPEVVVKSSFGTERAHSNANCMWGAGNYFSTTSSYSDNGYAHPVAGTTERKMVLFEVMTGLSFDSPANNALKKPPALPADHEVIKKFGAAAPPNLPYDSVTGVTKNTRIYITYSTGVAQQYPHYIITYKP